MEIAGCGVKRLEFGWFHSKSRPKQASSYKSIENKYLANLQRFRPGSIPGAGKRKGEEMFEAIQTLVITLLHSLFDKVDTILEIVIETISTPIAVHIYMAITINLLFVFIPGLISIHHLWEKGETL